jgi:tripartite-type tricarboxylate transporter receptor subunit TctC
LVTNSSASCSSSRPASSGPLERRGSSALEKKTAIDQLAALGSRARGSTTEEFTRFLEAETKKWGDLVRIANIKSSE